MRGRDSQRKGFEKRYERSVLIQSDEKLAYENEGFLYLYDIPCIRNTHEAVV